MIVVNIAGTSGSGKSHLVREFIAWAKENGVVKPVFDEAQSFKNPVGYDVILKRSDTLHIVGPYEKNGTAGCDVMRNVEAAYAYIHDATEAGKHVLYEGLFMMNMTRGPVLVEKYDAVCVIQLAVPLAVCMAGINSRRAERGEGPLLKKDNTKGNYVRANNYCDVMRGAGATVIRTKREDALATLVSVFGFNLKC